MHLSGQQIDALKDVVQDHLRGGSPRSLNGEDCEIVVTAARGEVLIAIHADTAHECVHRALGQMLTTKGVGADIKVQPGQISARLSMPAGHDAAMECGRLRDALAFCFFGIPWAPGIHISSEGSQMRA
jgi:hypothetical protein